MKKILYSLAIISILICCGCEAINNLDNTPTKKVEAYLNSYQSLDDNVLNDVDNILDEEITFNDEQRKRYREIVKKGYQELSYEIKDETIDGDSATVEVEIEVIDHSKILDEANVYLNEHKEEFNDNEGNYDTSLFTDYRIDMLEKNKEKVKYTIYFNLTKLDKEWSIEPLTESDIDKINGTYKH